MNEKFVYPEYRPPSAIESVKFSVSFKFLSLYIFYSTRVSRRRSVTGKVSTDTSRERSFDAFSREIIHDRTFEKTIRDPYGYFVLVTSRTRRNKRIREIHAKILSVISSRTKRTYRLTELK